MTQADHGTGSGPMAPRPAVVVRGKRRRDRNYRRIVATVITGSLVVVGALTAAATSYFYNHLSDNITAGADIDDIGGDRPDRIVLPNVPHQPLNILVMGTDTRDCNGCAIDTEVGGNASDTTILLHLSADRSRAYGISIPRDSMVAFPGCTTNSGGTAAPSSSQMWNAAFGIGGPECTVKQTEATTGIRIDHYVVVNFASFQNMVNAIGGVTMCIPQTIDDRSHGIYLAAGTRKLTGAQALEYVRVRHIGDGSDIGRVKRQQAFISSMVHSVMSSNTLSDPVRVLKFLNEATKSLYVDKDLKDLRELGGLAVQFKQTPLDKIQFVTVPWGADPADLNRVVWTSQADELWRLIKYDKPLTKDLLSGKVDATGKNTGQSKGNKGGKKDPSDDAALQAAGLCT